MLQLVASKLLHFIIPTRQNLINLEVANETVDMKVNDLIPDRTNSTKLDVAEAVDMNTDAHRGPRFLSLA